MAGVHTARRVAAAKLLASAASIGVALVLAGCSSIPFAPQPLSPTLVPAEVERSSSDYERILLALAGDSNITIHSSADWYRVVERGYIFVRGRCSEYFTRLHSFDRDTQAFQTGLDAFRQTADAILAVTAATKLTMTVVSQAFGLTSSLTRTVADSYLYTLPSAPTKDFVFKQLDAYQDESAMTQSAVRTPEAAYMRIQGFLDLCLPVTIEANLLGHVNKAVASADGGRSGSTVQVHVGSTDTVQMLKSLIDDVDKPRPAISGNVSDPFVYEPNIRSWQWAEIQRAICAKIDGDPGPATRAAMVEFFAGYGEPDPDLATRGITTVQQDVLFRAVREAKGQTCEERQVADAREAGALLK